MSRYVLTTQEDLYGFAPGTLQHNDWGILDLEEDNVVEWYATALEARDACDKLNEVTS